jgi:hypothetical protein
MKNPGQVSAKIALQDNTHVSSANPLPVESSTMESSLSNIASYLATLAATVNANNVMKVTPRDEDNTNGVDFDNETKVGGGVAHDAADSGSPLKVGGKAVSSLSGLTLPAANDRVNASFSIDGAQVVRENALMGDYVSGVASNTDGTSTSLIAAGAAGVKHAITDITIINTSASMIYVELKDDTTVKWRFPVPATGGVTHSFKTPLIGTAATAWNFDPSAATTKV